MEDLEKIGYSHWFQSRVDNEKATAHDVARVVSVHRDSYIVSKGSKDVYAELSGNLFYTANSTTVPGFSNLNGKILTALKNPF